MSRWRASGIHLLLSALVGIAVLLLLFFVWYPGPLFRAAGGEKLLLLIVGIDIIAGPLLTLIVFDTKKKSIKFDLAVIGLIQAGFLAYGLMTMTVSRPAFIAFAVDRYMVVAANAISDEDLAAAAEPEFRSVGWTGPRFVYVEMPTDSDEQMLLVDSALAGKDVESFPKYYRRHDEHTAKVVARAWTLSLLHGLDQQIDARIAELEGEHGAEQIAFLPLRTKLAEMSLVISKSDATPLAYLDIDPWSVIQAETIERRDAAEAQPEPSGPSAGEVGVTDPDPEPVAAPPDTAQGGEEG